LAGLARKLEDLPAGSTIRQVHFAAGSPIVIDGPPDAAAPHAGTGVDACDSDLARAETEVAGPQEGLPQLSVLVSDGRISSLGHRQPDAWWPVAPAPKAVEAGLGDLLLAPSETDRWVGRLAVIRPPGAPLRVEVLVDGRTAGFTPVPAGGDGTVWLDLVLDPLPAGRHRIEALHNDVLSVYRNLDLPAEAILTAQQSAAHEDLHIDQSQCMHCCRRIQ
jgi:hypothetical protein